MAGRSKMKYPDANEIKQFTQKLDKLNDISPQEANRIYSLFCWECAKTFFNHNSPEFDSELSAALQSWFEVVAEKIKEGKRGNFISTISFDNWECFNKFLLPAQKALEKHGTFEDLCNTVMIDEKTYLELPYKHLFESTTSEGAGDLQNVYAMKSFRAGMYYSPINVDDKVYTVGDLIKRFSPVAVVTSSDFFERAIYEIAFEIAAGARKLSNDLTPLGQRNVKPYLLVAFVRHKDISCIAAADFDFLHSVTVVPLAKKVFKNRFFLFAEKDKAYIVQEALRIPLEDIVKNALDRNVIDRNIAKNLLNDKDKPYSNFRSNKFIQTSVEYIDNVVQAKIEWKATRQRIEGEFEWLEEIR